MTERQTSKPPAKRPPARRNGREQGRVVRRYLGALEASRSGRGPRRTIEGIHSRVIKIEELLITADPLARLHLTQERIDLHSEIVRLSNGHADDLAELEKDFVRVAKAYGDLVGITFAAWRQVGVDADVLERAGIVRTAPARERPDGARPKAGAATATADAVPAAESAEAVPVAESAEAAPTEAAPAEAAQPSLPEIPQLPDPPEPVAAAEEPAPETPASADDAEPPPAEKPAPKLRRKRISDEGKS
jgi:hypothetical protein